ncbi:competence protein CoiA family protein [Streptomyces chartreusis]|uniref:competence protein CoiA family protein n=1 Tax=Streptomyces chartreusis TaxID=1969 RepID=UPI0036344A4E
MANGVWHSGLQRVLELDKEDLGLGNTWPGLAELRASLLHPVAKRDRELLVCIQRSQGLQCKAELAGVKSPHMYVRQHRGRDGLLRLRAVHLPTTHEMTPEESDRHKAMKDFLARTGQAAGLEVHVEKATKNRTSRPDVTIVGASGVSLGCEAQYYNASADTVLRRSKAHAESGLVANWITHDDRFHLIDRSNWMLTRPLTWREISDAADLVLVGGFRVLVEWQCTASAERPCPDNRVKTGCGKVHLQWAWTTKAPAGPASAGTPNPSR